MDVTFWQDRLDRYARRYDVPAASLAVLHDGKVTALATGVLNLRTGVAATTDSLFQIGSITKVYTATVVLRLLARHGHTVDTPVAEILPDFRVRDPDVSKQVTVGQLLDHTSGIDGDLFLDTGRGDDCVTRYIEACADLPQNHPLGATMSYCNSGYVVLGRIVEQLRRSSAGRRMLHCGLRRCSTGCPVARRTCTAAPARRPASATQGRPSCDRARGAVRPGGPMLGARSP